MDQDTPVYPDDQEEADEARAAQVESAMQAAGQPTEVKVQDDYFGFEVAHTCYLPDGKSFVEHIELNEGARRKYLNAMNRDARFKKGSGDMVVKMAPGDERKALLQAALSGWNLVRGGQEVPFNERNLSEFLEKAPPKVCDVIEKDVRAANAWLISADMTVEQIDEEIASLTELRVKLIEEEAGKAA